MEQQVAGVLKAARLWARVTRYLQAVRAEVSVPPTLLVPRLCPGKWEGGGAWL